MSDLSERQNSILEFIRGEIRKKGYPPSVREIGLAVGLKSSSTVHSHLSQLEENGYIKRDRTKPRAIEMVKDRTEITEEEEMFVETVNVPLVGEITAGEPILADERIESYYPLPVEFASGKDTFMLTVHGDSMIEAGIFEGDLLVVRKQEYADNGDIVVALMEDDATVKRFFKGTDYIRLQPENSTMEPIIVRDVQVLGKVVGLVRKY